MPHSSNVTPVNVPLTLRYRDAALPFSAVNQNITTANPKMSEKAAITIHTMSESIGIPIERPYRNTNAKTARNPTENTL
jgi:hypothetical protein